MKKIILLFSILLVFNTNAQDNIPSIDLKTLDGKTLNISPYNKKYDENIYSMSPQPRAVANAVLVYLNS